MGFKTQHKFPSIVRGRLKWWHKVEPIVVILRQNQPKQGRRKPTCGRSPRKDMWFPPHPPHLTQECIVCKQIVVARGFLMKYRAWKSNNVRFQIPFHVQMPTISAAIVIFARNPLTPTISAPGLTLIPWLILLQIIWEWQTYHFICFAWKKMCICIRSCFVDKMRILIYERIA